MKICGENCHFLSNSSELDIFKYGIYHSVRSYVLKVEKKIRKSICAKIVYAYNCQTNTDMMLKGKQNEHDPSPLFNRINQNTAQI